MGNRNPVDLTLTSWGTGILQYLPWFMRVLYIPGIVVWDFWTISSMITSYINYCNDFYDTCITISRGITTETRTFLLMHKNIVCCIFANSATQLERPWAAVWVTWQHQPSSFHPNIQNSPKTKPCATGWNQWNLSGFIETESGRKLFDYFAGRMKVLNEVKRFFF